MLNVMPWEKGFTYFGLIKGAVAGSTVTMYRVECLACDWLKGFMFDILSFLVVVSLKSCGRCMAAPCATYASRSNLSVASNSATRR